jgi:hypothetical protein
MSSKQQRKVVKFERVPNHQHHRNTRTRFGIFPSRPAEARVPLTLVRVSCFTSANLTSTLLPLDLPSVTAMKGCDPHSSPRPPHSHMLATRQPKPCQCTLNFTFSKLCAWPCSKLQCLCCGSVDVVAPNCTPTCFLLRVLRILLPPGLLPRGNRPWPTSIWTALYCRCHAFDFAVCIW